MTNNSENESKTIHERLGEIKRRYADIEHIASTVSADDEAWLISQVEDNDAELSFREACCAELVRLDSRKLAPPKVIKNFIIEKIQQTKNLPFGKCGDISKED